MGKIKRWDEPNLSRSKAINLIQEFPDIVYKNHVQEKLVACDEDPFAVASVLGKYFHPMLKKGIEDGDKETVCFLCDLFRKIKICLFPLEPEPQCAGDRCDILKEVGRKDGGIRESKSDRVSKRLPAKRRKRSSKNGRTKGAFSRVEEQTEGATE